MKRVLNLCLFLLMGSMISSQTKEEDIKKLLDLSGTQTMAEQIVQALLPQFKSMAPQVPEEFWAALIKEMEIGEYLMLSIPLYDKYYTHEEIKQLIAFYESEIGKKTVEIMPQMTQ